MRRHRGSSAKEYLARYERREARQALAEAVRHKRTMSKAEAEALYRRLERSKRQLETSDDPRSIQLSRRITSVLSRYVGPRSRGRDASRSPHRHRSAGAPTFAQQRAIGRKMRILERENAARRGKAKRSQAQMLAIAYRYAGVSPRGTRRSRR
jgi:hypothetical protein